MKKKLIYIRTPKTSSTSLCHAFTLSKNKFYKAARCLKERPSVEEYVKIVEENDIILHPPIRRLPWSSNARQKFHILYLEEGKKQKNWIQFALVRDPYTKFISSVNHWLTKEALDLVLENDIPLLQGKSILNNLDDKIKKEMPTGKYANNVFDQMLTQTSFLFNDNNSVCKVLKYEDREELENFLIKNEYEDIVEIMNKRGKKNTSYKHNPKPFELNQKIINYVNKFYSEDFTNFGYTML
tara:strand:- start:84 stop:803 length:720 start_codon:yes stop_codon:yes gene_type:complete